jgi:D-aminopeptidase
MSPTSDPSRQHGDSAPSTPGAPAPPARRARDWGLPFPGTPGPANAITDVPGIAVGTWQRVDSPDPREPVAWRIGEGPVRTGVTAIVPHAGSPEPLQAWAGTATLNGNGEMTGTHWIADHGAFAGPVLITNTHSVGAAHEGAVRWMTARWPQLFRDDHAWAMPVVAETYDGFTNDILGFHVRPEHAIAAIEDALRRWREAAALAAGAGGAHRGAAVPEGNAGGGAGMQSFGLKGGTGTSSRIVDVDGGRFRVGALVQSNFGSRRQLTILGRRVGPELAAPNPFEPAPETGSIIVVLATDAPMSPPQLQRLARRAGLGIARTGGTAGNYSGELMLALSVAEPLPARGVTSPRPWAHAPRQLDESWLDGLFEAAVEATEEAIVNALFAAAAMSTIRPPGVLHAIDREAVARLLRAP